MRLSDSNNNQVYSGSSFHCRWCLPRCPPLHWHALYNSGSQASYLVPDRHSSTLVFVSFASLSVTTQSANHQTQTSSRFSWLLIPLQPYWHEHKCLSLRTNDQVSLNNDVEQTCVANGRICGAMSSVLQALPSDVRGAIGCYDVNGLVGCRHDAWRSLEEDAYTNPRRRAYAHYPFLR